ncbi:MAG: GNAT family N-acetyltransferase [Pseudonocardiales bacterium]|nr:GNAT family N-acetyltransferase [Pseudonocardiales bacterium]
MAQPVDLPAQIELTGSRVRLREFRADDLDDSLAVVGDDRVTRFLSFDSRDRDQARAMITGTIERASARPRTEYYLSVALPDDDRLIGFARLGLTGVRAAKLGAAVAADHWGHGYATDATRTMLDFGFGQLDLHRVTAAIGPDNAASIAVVKRLGFSYEGRLRDHVFTNGAWRDSLLYSMLGQEWPRPE